MPSYLVLTPSHVKLLECEPYLFSFSSSHFNKMEPMVNFSVLLKHLEKKEIKKGDLRNMKSATFLRINSKRKIFPASWQPQPKYSTNATVTMRTERAPG